MEDYQKAELDYINGMKYKDIAEKYGKSVNTVKSWKTRYKWSKEKSAVDLKKAHKTEKSMHTKPLSVQGAHVKKFVNEQIDISNNSDLTEREEMFCVYYAQRPNQTKAYMKAYQNDNYNTSQTGAWGLMRKPKIINRIRELKRGVQEVALLELTDVISELKKQAFADVSDYIEYYTEKVYEWDSHFNEETNEFEDEPRIDPNTGEQAFHYKNTVRFKDIEETDTSLLKSVKLNREGQIELELYDKQKALLELMKFIGDAQEKQIKLEKLKMDTKISEARSRLLSGTDDKTENAISNLMNTLLGVAKDE